MDRLNTAGDSVFNREAVNAVNQVDSTKDRENSKQTLCAGTTCGDVVETDGNSRTGQQLAAEGYGWQKVCMT